MRRGQIQMVGIVGLAIVASVATFAYLAVSPPAYLRETRDGVPYFTPPVIDPTSDKALSVDMLVRHYKRDHGDPDSQTAPIEERNMHLDFQTWVQIGMFGVMFYVLYVGLIEDVF
jgi:hypothetical protein